MIARILKPCKAVVLDMVYKHAHGDDALDLPFTPLTLTELYVELNTKVCVSLPLIARIMKPCIVIIREILYQQAS